MIWVSKICLKVGRDLKKFENLLVSEVGDVSYGGLEIMME